jgi:putative nucleotidyltransferase with HDIG domain
MSRIRLWTEPRLPSSFGLPRGLIDALRGAHGRRLFIAASGIAGLLLAVGLLISSTGGGSTPFVHLLYVPVVLAAIVFKSWGGLAVGLLAGLISSPLVTGAFESAGAWLIRTLIFALIGWAFGEAHELLERRLRAGKELVKKLSTVQARTLSTFASTVDLRDKPTSGHSSRVAHNARAMAVAVGLAQETLRAVYWAGLLHDLGKIAIPERILQKPGSLTPDEITTMRRHSDIGANLLLSVSADLRQIADGVRSHHERWDGSGYPRQISKEEIPLVGRIVSIVDVFEALTCSRPYRKPQPVPEVLEFVRERSGLWFDPDMVPLLEDLYWNGEIYTAASVQAQLPVEEPPIDITDDPSVSFLQTAGRRDYHLGSSGRP